MKAFGVGGPARSEEAAQRCTDAERKRDSAQPYLLNRTVGPTLKEMILRRIYK